MPSEAKATDTIWCEVASNTVVTYTVEHTACPGHTEGLGTERDVQVMDSDLGHCIHVQINNLQTNFFESGYSKEQSYQITHTLARPYFF